MTNYYDARRQLTLLVEEELRDEGEITLSRLYFKAQRNWGLGKKAVDKVLSTLVDVDRIEIGEFSVFIKQPRRPTKEVQDATEA